MLRVKAEVIDMALMDERPPLASSSFMFVRVITAPEVVRGRHRQTNEWFAFMYVWLSVCTYINTST
jgi:hypothetical protein